MPGPSKRRFKLGGMDLEALGQCVRRVQGSGQEYAAMQVSHGGNNHFGYKVVAMAREALQDHPNPELRDLRGLETAWKVKLLSGAPAKENEDPDGVGLQDWQVVLYCAGSSPNAALDLVHLILKHKVNKGHAVVMPNLCVAAPPQCDLLILPEPWVLFPAAEMLPPFGAVPPSGRRHILGQLEIKEARGDSQAENILYIFSLFGGIYLFRELFEASGIPGTYIKQGGDSDYMRYMEFTDSDEHKEQIQHVLQNVLLRRPVYFINGTGDADNGMAVWMIAQDSVFLQETDK
ncbi:hypothetical protein AK812_SmicGene43929 [Symbiodinium microadriaticum]|uniref:Uncharacterized protein n=1 Tax=Symbiodinium microadriaticum TaxID=2951 RepID=A0A1Q9BZR7_SYMMI|nr:hypothetical protein AK812_SmicGene43929 [Symbiodinium microadriaticum]CAE7237839.1 unnamed protein product [Symbiodinium sp. KB8]